MVAQEATLVDRRNCVYMGTTVRNGSATVAVAETGSVTEYGRIAHRLGRPAPETEFERGMRHFGVLLARVVTVLVLGVVVINTYRNQPPIEALMFAIALAVGLSPELLPAVISVTLARGAMEMADSGVIVRRL